MFLKRQALGEKERLGERKGKEKFWAAQGRKEKGAFCASVVAVFVRLGRVSVVCGRGCVIL